MLSGEKRLPHKTVMMQEVMIKEAMVKMVKEMVRILFFFYHYF